MHADEQTRGALYRAVTASPHLVRYYDAGSTVTALRGSADGRVIVAGLEDGRVLAWNAGESGEPREVTRLDDAITEVALTHDGGVVVASDGEELYRSDDGSTPDLPNRFVLDTFAISPTGRSLVAYGRAESGSGSRTVVAGANGTQTVSVAEPNEYAGWDGLTFASEDRVGILRKWPPVLGSRCVSSPCLTSSPRVQWGSGSTTTPRPWPETAASSPTPTAHQRSPSGPHVPGASSSATSSLASR